MIRCARTFVGTAGVGTDRERRTTSRPVNGVDCEALRLARVAVTSATGSTDMPIIMFSVDGPLNELGSSTMASSSIVPMPFIAFPAGVLRILNMALCLSFARAPRSLNSADGGI